MRACACLCVCVHEIADVLEWTCQKCNVMCNCFLLVIQTIWWIFLLELIIFCHFFHIFRLLYFFPFFRFFFGFGTKILFIRSFIMNFRIRRNKYKYFSLSFSIELHFSSIKNAFLWLFFEYWWIILDSTVEHRYSNEGHNQKSHWNLSPNMDSTSMLTPGAILKRNSFINELVATVFVINSLNASN